MRAVVLGLMGLALAGYMFSFLSPAVCVVIVAIAMILWGRDALR